MIVREAIITQLKTIYPPGVVSAGQVYKGWNYDGTVQAYGWWFEFFDGSKLYLGRGQTAAEGTICRIREERRHGLEH